jgi:hypothetical protein
VGNEVFPEQVAVTCLVMATPKTNPPPAPRAGSNRLFPASSCAQARPEIQWRVVQIDAIEKLIWSPSGEQVAVTCLVMATPKTEVRPHLTECIIHSF